MAIVRRRTPAANRLNQIEQRMQQLLDQPFRLPFVTEDMGWSPSVEVNETDGAIEVTAELPGVVREDIEVGLENNVLTIRGEKKEERREGGRRAISSSATTALSSGASRCPPWSTRIGSRQSSRMGC
jgi:HSP20 family molecular chaperone IbpA